MAQLSLKKTLAKMLQWIKAPMVASDVANSEPFYNSKRTDTGVQVAMGVGSGGYNHGVYSYKLSKWLIYGDSSTVYVDNIPMSKASGEATKSGDYYSSGYIKYFRMNGIVSMYFGGIVMRTISSNVTIATIPAGFRPPMDMVISTTTGTTQGCYVTPSGGITVQSGMSGKTIWGSVSYIAWN